jgi:hypothetical protein
MPDASPPPNPAHDNPAPDAPSADAGSAGFADAAAAAREADRRFATRRNETGARDPREYYRGLLRDLRGEDPDGYRELVARYEAEVVGAIGTGEADPLEAWLAFGAALATRVAGPGALLSVDAAGAASPADPPYRWDQLLLHLPEGRGRASGGRSGIALPVGLPPELSRAQKATVDLLVHGKVRAPEPSSSPTHAGAPDPEDSGAPDESA